MKWFWRIVAGVGSGSLLALAIMFWSAWRASRFQPSVQGEPLPSGIDVISIQLDILSLIIAIAGIILAVLGLFGYQAIKAGAEAEAAKTAAAKADEVATKAVALHMENIQQTLDGLRSGNGLDAVEPTEVEPETDAEKEG